MTRWRRRRSRVPVRTALALVVALALVTAGCGSSPQGPLPPPARFGVNATGTVHFWVRSSTQIVARALVKEFNATHPHLKVVITPITDGTGADLTELATAIRAGSAPDVDGIDDIDVPLFAHEHALVNLTPYIDALPYHASLSKGQIALGDVNGTLYSIPYLADLSVLWYNKVLFRRAGLNPEDPPKTFAQILTDAMKINALGHGIHGFDFAGDCAGCSAFALLPMIFAAGTSLVAGPLGHQHATIEGNRPLTELLELLHTMWADHLTPPSDQSQNGSTFGDAFVQGTIGIEPNGYGGIIGELPKSMYGEVADAPLPGPDGGYSTFDGGDNFVIPKGARNPSGAWEFIKFALQRDQQLQYPTLNYTPVRSDLLGAAYRKEFPFDAVALDALRHGVAGYSLAWDDIDNATGAPWLIMLQEAAFAGNIEKALQLGQTGIQSDLNLAGT